MTIATLADLIATVETGGNPAPQFASKFEPDWSYTTPQSIERCMAVHGCSEATADTILRTSWGFYQIMGSVIYDLTAGTPPHIFRSYLSTPSLQLIYFNHFNSQYCGTCTLNDFLTNDPAAAHFCSRWNGNEAVYMGRCQDILRSQGLIK